MMLVASAPSAAKPASIASRRGPIELAAMPRGDSLRRHRVVATSITTLPFACPLSR